MRYAIVIEKADGNYSAYVPDLPGCVATGATIETVETKSGTPFDFTWMGSRLTDFPSPRQPASPTKSRHEFLIAEGGFVPAAVRRTS